MKVAQEDHQRKSSAQPTEGAKQQHAEERNGQVPLRQTTLLKYGAG
jgi:hypothetical protein